VFSLIKYNLSYYIKSAKYLPPVICFAAFFAFNYQVAPIGIWSNLHITGIAIFILSSWVGMSFMNSEDKTQQYITRLHVKNETIYYLSKIVSIIIFLIPFYLITILRPSIFGMFTRDILFSEILIYIVVYFLVSLLGVSAGIFFHYDLLSGEMAILTHILFVILAIVPFNVIFADNIFVVYASYLLPPINFLAEKLHDLGDDVFYVDSNFWIFVIYALGYALILMTLYNIVIQRRNKK